MSLDDCPPPDDIVPPDDVPLPPDPEADRPKSNGKARAKRKPVDAVPEGTAGAIGETYDCNETGNALRLESLYRARFRHVAAWGADLIWHHVHWREDTTGAAWDFVRGAIDDVILNAHRSRGETRDELLAWAVKSANHSRMRGALEIARKLPTIRVDPSQLDSDPWLLNTRSATIDLRTGRGRKHDPADLITKLAPVDFDVTAQAPRWERFLEEALPDAAVREYVQRFIGYALTGVIREHVLVVFWGEGGNGKSTFVDAISHAIGSYHVHLPRNILMASPGERHPTDLTMLDGARLAVASETRTGAAFDESLVKSLTGGDPITAHRMRMDNYTFAPTHKLVLLTNPKPRVHADDAGIWRRIHLVPWSVSFVGREDTRLPDTLRAEAPGILAWAVRGCLEWQRRGLDPPEAVRAATETYREEQDTLGEFWALCEFNPDARVPRKALFERYERFARAEGIKRPFGKRSFAGRVRAKLVEFYGPRHNPEISVRESKEFNPVDAWRGLRIVDRDESDVSDQGELYQ